MTSVTMAINRDPILIAKRLGSMRATAPDRRRAAPSPTPNLPSGGSSSVTPFSASGKRPSSRQLVPKHERRDVLSRYGWSGTPDTITSARAKRSPKPSWAR